MSNSHYERAREQARQPDGRFGPQQRQPPQAQLSQSVRESTHTNEDRQLVIQRFDEAGRLHCLDEPAYTRRYATGEVAEEGYYQHGVVHRLDGPARSLHAQDGIMLRADFLENGQYVQGRPSIIKWYASGRTRSATWTDAAGEPYHDSEPAVIEYYDMEGSPISRMSWEKGYGPEREDGPAVMEYYPDRTAKQAEYWTGGLPGHPEGEPSLIKWHPNGMLARTEHLDFGRPHRARGPAVEVFNDHGELLCQSWYCDGMLHNLTGPAHIDYRPGKSHYIYAVLGERFMNPASIEFQQAEIAFHDYAANRLHYIGMIHDQRDEAKRYYMAMGYSEQDATDMSYQLDAHLYHRPDLDVS